MSQRKSQEVAKNMEVIKICKFFITLRATHYHDNALG